MTCIFQRNVVAKYRASEHQTYDSYKQLADFLNISLGIQISKYKQYKKQ